MLYLCTGDCPRVIRLVLATNIIANSVNYMIGGTYYYAGEAMTKHVIGWKCVLELICMHVLVAQSLCLSISLSLSVFPAYGVNDRYEVVNADPCQDGVKFKIYIEEKSKST